MAKRKAAVEGKSLELFGGRRHPGFPKGQSGNPGGLPRGIAEVKELARQHTAQAIETLAKIMNDEMQPGPARILAANSLLDRGFGKPQLHAQTDITFHAEIDSMTAQELREFVKAETLRLGIFTTIEAKVVEEALQ